MREASLWYLLIPLVILLAIAGMVASQTLLRGGDQQCGTGPVGLESPVAPATIVRALNDLYEEGVIASPEDAFEQITSVAWVLDPADDYRLEYWIEFEGRNTAGFELICVDPDMEFVWKYDGIQAPVGE